MFQGSLINGVARPVTLLVLVAAFGHLTAMRVEAQQGPPNRQALLIPPAWSQILTADRFQLVMGGAAVLDRETGLVWEQSPDTSLRQWFVAVTHCYQKSVGGRKGWRLPSVEELASLVNASNSSPALPTGHPFTLTS